MITGKTFEIFKKKSTGIREWFRKPIGCLFLQGFLGMNYHFYSFLKSDCNCMKKAKNTGAMKANNKFPISN